MRNHTKTLIFLLEILFLTIEPLLALVMTTLSFRNMINSLKSLSRMDGKRLNVSDSGSVFLNLCKMLFLPYFITQVLKSKKLLE